MKQLIWAAALAGLAWSGHAAANEMVHRQAVCAEVVQLLQKDDFAGLERRYAQAVAQRQRLPSGLFVSSRFLHCLPEAVDAVRVGGSGATGGSGGSLSSGSGGGLVAGGSFDLRKYQEDQWKVLQDKAARWTQAYPSSSLAAIAQSIFYVQQGYVYRGYGSASGVAPQDMELFAQWVAKGHDVLNARAAAGAKDPGWYAQMLQIARLQQWQPQRFSELLRQAVQAHPGDYEIYFAAGEMLVPQWGGSFETLQAFADFAANHTKASEGDALYARIYWRLSPYLGSAAFASSQADWKRVRAGFEGIIKQYPDSWNLNGYARLACAAQDRATLSRLLATVGDRVEPEIWKTRQTYNTCRQLIATKPKGDGK